MMQAADVRQSDVEFQKRLYTDANPTRRGLHIARRDWVLSRTLERTRPGDRILEVGVGCGVFTEALAAEGRKVTAVDINPAFLDNVKGLAEVSTHLKDATVPLNLGEHDLAICSEVIEHVPPERSVAMLRTLFEALRPGGALILSTPQRFATVELGARLFKFKPVLAIARKLYGSADELGHINLLTSGQMEAQLREVGFRTREMRRFGFYLPVVAEFGGRPGAALLRASGSAISHIPGLRHLLWTQGWVLERPAAGDANA